MAAVLISSSINLIGCCYFRTAIVVYQLFYRMVLGWSFNWGGLIKFLSRVSLGAYVHLLLADNNTQCILLNCFISFYSVAMGFAFGMASVLWLGFIFNDTVIEISLTLAVSYLAFFTVRTLLSLFVLNMRHFVVDLAVLFCMKILFEL